MSRWFKKVKKKDIIVTPTTIHAAHEKIYELGNSTPINISLGTNQASPYYAGKPHNWQMEDIPKSWTIFWTSTSWDRSYPEGLVLMLMGLDGRKVAVQNYIFGTIV